MNNAIKAAIPAALSVFAVSTALPAYAASILADGGFEAQGTASTSNYCYFGFSAAGNPACLNGVWLGRDSVGGQQGPGGSGFQFESNGAWPGLPTPDGSRYAFIQWHGTVFQNFTPTQSGTYQLSWLDAGRPAGCCGGNQSYIVTIDDGINLAPVLYSGSTTTGQAWTARQSAFTFGLTAGTAYTLTFRGLNPLGGDNTAFIDAVSLDTVAAAVPEPASWALMLTGFAAAGAAVRRRSKVRITYA